MDGPDYSTQHVVSPYGETNVVQAGIAIKRGKSLRALLTRSDDASQMEMNPEAFRTLRERFLHDAR